MDKECLEKVTVLHGVLETLGNGFTIRNPDGEALVVFHSSLETPYKELKKFINRNSEIVVTEEGQIIDIFPMREKSLTD